jgi:HTH-type transcriptional regulator/antitoxin HigA
MTGPAYGSGWASPPGVALEEWRAGQRMSRSGLAAELGLSETQLAELVTGRLELTLGLVVRLETVTGIPRRMWAAMEALYRADLIRQETLADH